MGMQVISAGALVEPIEDVEAALEAATNRALGKLKDAARDVCFPFSAMDGDAMVHGSRLGTPRLISHSVCAVGEHTLVLLMAEVVAGRERVVSHTESLYE